MKMAALYMYHSRREFFSRKQRMAGYQEEINSRILALNERQGQSAEQEVDLGKYAFVEGLAREAPT